MDSQKKSLSLNFGIAIGIIYCVLIFCQNQFFYSSPLGFSLSKILCYLLIVAGFFYSGYTIRKKSGGYISFKDCLGSLLIVIVITELFYVIFSTIYIKYIDPTFIEKLKSSWHSYYISHNIPQDKTDNTIDNFKEARKITIGTLVQSFGFGVIIDAIFGVIISAVLKKIKPELKNQIS